MALIRAISSFNSNSTKISMQENMMDSGKFCQHLGYDAIMKQLPRVYPAVCGHPQLDNSISPFNAALSTLVFLYEDLQAWEDMGSPVSASSDFGYACDLLIACYSRFDPLECKAIARYISGLLEIYKTHLERLPGSSVPYAKSSPRY